MSARKGAGPDLCDDIGEARKTVVTGECDGSLIKPSSQQTHEFLLTAIRTAVLRCKLDENELVTIGIALKADMITPDYAVEWLAEIGPIDREQLKLLRIAEESKRELLAKWSKTSEGAA